MYLLHSEPIGIRAMMESDVASVGGLNRAIRDLILEGLIGYDKTRRVPGRPLVLTAKGRRVAAKVAEIEEILRGNTTT